MTRSLVRIFVASLATAGLLALALAALGDITARGVLLRAGVVAGGGVLSMGVLLLFLRLLKVEELAMLAELGRSLRGRLGGR